MGNFLFLLSTLLIADVQSSLPKGDHMNATDELLSNYGHVYSRPVPFFNQTIVVEFFMYVNQIIELNEREQLLTVSALIEMEWQDRYLIWNTTKYPSVTHLNFPISEIWHPDVWLYENVHLYWPKDGLCWLSPDGKVIWAIASIFTTSCRIDARFFPFDTQRCTVRFASWVHPLSQMDMTLRSTRSISDSREYFTENGIWDLVTVDMQRHVIQYDGYGGYPELLYTLVLSRRPLFHVLTMILPCALLSLLNLMVFILPTESGEKVSFGITNVLALVVFLQLVGETMPPSSDKMPIVIIYYFTPMIVTGCLAVTSGVIVAYLHQHHTISKTTLQSDKNCDDDDIDECCEDSIYRNHVTTVRKSDNAPSENVSGQHQPFEASKRKKCATQNTEEQESDLCKLRGNSFSAKELATLINKLLLGTCIFITFVSMVMTTSLILCH
ncbi:neuronal acetylcholine receptor subunit alpha-7-like [Amphiura filiformis]|uniref:neuronal acetylcholine receptor subunit alpha-7-like n=1 Tax=Amphiura filiformis TaxID=82378 RepID=UPI003B2279B2